MSDDDDEPGPSESDEPESLSELVDQLGHETGTLVLRELTLSATHHVPEVRRAARLAAALAVIAAALAAAFALANWAVVDALSSSLQGWRAPLVVAGFWLVVGVVVLVVVMVKLGNASGLRWWRDTAEVQQEVEKRRDEAAVAVRTTLVRTGPVAAREGAKAMAAATVPLAEGVVDAGEAILDIGDNMLETVEAQMPQSGAVREVVDLMLIPGRFGLRIATTVLRGGNSKEKPPDDSDDEE
jgi:hypothetical protein